MSAGDRETQRREKNIRRCATNKIREDVCTDMVDWEERTTEGMCECACDGATDEE